MNYQISALIFPKRGVLDTQGRAVMGTLVDMGFRSVRDVSVGRFVRLSIEAEDQASALSTARRICQELLANELIEDFSLKEGDLSL
ncbi:phosphoribosylformylglycinamidine synthase subunit PurS [Thermanaerovibrio acidaminovorans]|jgi:phosphoribosylaminoimidazole-succinocarboxamide synthase/phosphoribosylformylglycinamidine synthase|uniref:phosphoribosylformylglycinamidine synthase subunit PurS n=1 Tax=Thermanaerovibrio acidaminovorans TaxID=81462 RepID=UPI00248FA3F5|nr:phosphoribosylformylglycinamidine synthase subunit PurS [Thermanaerovibrio acidaminovorans]